MDKFRNVSANISNAAENQRNVMDMRMNNDIYSIDISDEDYSIFAPLIADSSDPAKAEDTAYRIASALKYAEIYNITAEEAYANLDIMNAANFGDAAALPKSNFTAICDAWQQGIKQLERNNIGNSIREIEESGFDPSEKYTELDLIDQEIAFLDDKQSRSWLVNAGKYGAQSAPFTGAAIASGAVGALLGGGIGAAILGTTYSFDAMRGEEYLQLRKDGASVETAGRVADTVAFANAIVETALGEVMAGVGTVAGKALTKSGTISKQIIDKATKDVLKGMYYGGGWKRAAAVATRTGLEYLAEATEEGIEEVVQELVSSYGRSLAASLDEYEEDPSVRAELGMRVAESFKGGFMGALVLGVTNAAFNARATVSEFKEVDTTAKLAGTEEDFIKKTNESPVFEGMTDEAKLEAQKDIYAKAEPARAKMAEEKRNAALATAETIDVGERTEETVEDEAAQVVRNDEYRTKEGKLNYSDTVIDQNDDGSTDNQFLVKGKGKEEYGRIIYNVNGDNVTITDFTLSPTRENLRQEVFTDFAEKFAGKNIDWETRSDEAAAVKQGLIDQNTRGSKEGLNYFESTKSSRNQRARVSILQEIKAARPNATNEELITDLAMVESRAAFKGMSIADLYEDKGQLVRNYMTEEERENTISYFMSENPNLTREEAENKVDTNIGGFFSRDSYEKSRRGFIYISKNSNAQTFMHEYMHSLRSDFSQEENERAAKAIGVKDANNWTREEEELLVDYFTKWATEGVTEKPELVPLFKKIANALAALYSNLLGKLELSQDVVDFFDSLFSDPTNALAQAKAALSQMDQEAYQAENTVVEENVNEGIINDGSLSYVDRAAAAMEECGDLMLQLIPESYAQNIGKLGNIEAAKKDYENGVSLEKIYDTYRVVLGNTGEWMYETDDRKYIVTQGEAIDSILARTGSEVLRMQRFLDLIKSGRNIDQAEYGFKQQAQLLQQQIDLLNDQYKTLGDLYDSEELYKANPELRNLRVGFFQSAVGIKAVQVDGGFAFNVYHIRNEQMLKGSIAYEIQLALQKGIVTNVESARYWNAVVEATRNIDSNKYGYDFMNAMEILKEMAMDPYNLDAAARDRINMNLYKRRENAVINEKEKLNNKKLLYSIIGEQGAKALDEAEDKTERIDNLAIAQVMDQEGKDYKTIRLATGWEKGVDDKWRYEIDDSNINVNIMTSYTKKNPRYNELYEKYYNQMFNNGEPLTDAEIKELDKLSDDYNDEYTWRTEGLNDPGYHLTLEDIMDNQELFTAYPELKSIKIVNSSIRNADRTRGVYKSFENKIVMYVNPDAIDEYKSILLHEIQHVIQGIEGFATGGSVNFFKEKRERYESLVESIEREMETIDKTIPEEDKIDFFSSNFESPEDYEQKEKEFYSKYDNGPEYLRLQNILYKIQAENRDVRFKSDFDNYRSLAGEVEARNVQSRMTLSEAIRRETALRDTEDVVREEQIVLFQEIDDVRKQYEGADQWMKAPNGADTKLTENQWLQVRTESFKNWFGDWESDPQNASKIVDENGEPLVVYHGTNAAEDFEVFNTTLENTTDKSNIGSHFGPKSTAEDFSDNIYEVFLNIRKPYYPDFDFFADELNNAYLSTLITMRENIKNPEAAKEFEKIYDIYPILKNYNVEDLNDSSILDEFEDDENIETGSFNDFMMHRNAMVDIMKAMMKAGGYDGMKYQNWHEGDYNNECYVAFMPNQIKSATDNNGSFDADNPSILFQSTEQDISEAMEALKDYSEPEQKRISGNLERLKGTPWYNSTIKALRARKEIYNILETGTVPETGLVLDTKNYKEILTDGDTKEERIENVWDYFECVSSLIGHPAKPLNSVASSFINCNPSPDCARYCYAVKGRSSINDLIFNRELVNFCIENDPVRAARDVADEYKCMAEYRAGGALRLLDTGDLSEPWIKFIEELNNNGVACQVFSKRPELLSQIDSSKNVVMLSIDESNLEVAEENPTLPLAYVYNGSQKSLNFIDANKERYSKYNGVILPVVMNGKRLTQEQVLAMPRWTLNYTCPIDAGWKELGNRRERKKSIKKWNCSVCDANGQGCFFRRAIDDRKQFYATLKEMPVELVRSITDEIKQNAESKLKSLGLSDIDIRSILETCDSIVNEKLAGYDTEGTGSEYAGYNDSLSETSGTTESTSAENGNEEQINKLFQIVYHGSPYVIRRPGGQELRGEELGFDHSKMGTGEGAQAYGWGTYVTQVKGIAEGYASMAKNSYDKAAEDMLNTIGITNPVEMNWAINVFFEIISHSLDEVVKRRESRAAMDPERFKLLDKDTVVSIYDYVISNHEKIQSGYKNNQNVYTLDIPDDGVDYLQWDRDIDASEIGNKLYNYLIQHDEDGSYAGNASKYLKDELSDVFNLELDGSQIYRNIQAYLGRDKDASLFLSDLGYIGISYPADNLRGGRDDGARNFVIFNEDDIIVTDWHAKDQEGNQLFQYLQDTIDEETLREAAGFTSWEEWYEYAQVMDDDGLVTGAWDAVTEKEWFKQAWEYAQQIYNQNSNTDTEQFTEPLEDLDQKFIDTMKQDGAIDDFVTKVRQYSDMAAGLSSPIDEAEAADFDRIMENSSFINDQMQDPVWQSETLTDSQRKKIMSLIKDAPKVYRGIYSDVYNDDSMAISIPERTRVDTFLDLPEEELIKMDRMTPSQRREMIKELEDEEIKNQVLNGTYKVDGAIDRAIDVAGEEIKKLQKEIDRLNEEYKDDLDEIKNQQKRDFVEEYNRLLEMYDQIKDKSSKSITDAIEAGKQGSSDASSVGKKGQLNDIQRRMDQLQTLLKGERDAIAAIEKAKAKQEYSQKLKDKLKQRAIKSEIRRMRNGLVKSITRKVSFKNVYYDDARQIIAAQDFMNEWLTSGVNQWIGKETPFLRKVYSDYITDEVKRKEIIDALSKSKSRRRADHAIQLLEGARDGTGKTFDDWTAEERKVLHIALGQTDWVNALNLESKDKYRREAMHGAYNEDGTLTDAAMDLVEKILPPEMIANIQYKPMVGWTLEEMEALAKIIDDKYVEGKKVLAGMQQQRRNEIESIRDQIEQIVKDTGIVINPDDSDEDKKKKSEKIRKILGMRTQLKGTAASAAEKASLKDRIMSIDRGTGNARRFARVMDNYSESVFTTTLCFREYMAYDEEMKHLNERNKYVQKWMADNGLTIDELQQQHRFPGFMDGEDFVVTTDDLLYIYVADQDEMSQAAVMYGNFGTASEQQSGKRDDSAMAYKGTKWYTRKTKARYDTVLRYAENLINGSDKLKGFVDLIERDYAKQYDRLNEASITVFNQPVNRVNNYVPLYRREMSGEENEKKVMLDLQANTTGAPASYVNRGNTINRIKINPLNQKPVELGLFKTWAESSQATEHFIAYGGYVRDLNAIFTAPSAAATREVIASRYGDDANNYIKNYINELANPNKHEQKATVDKIVHVLRGKTAPAYLAWKTSGIIKQLCTSPWPFMTYVSPAAYLSAMGKFMVPFNKMSELVKEKSVFMANRTIDPIMDLIKEAEDKADNKVKAMFAQFNKTGMQGLEWADWISVAPGWYAVYEAEKNTLNKLNAGKTELSDGYISAEEIERKAVAKADDIVRLTQPSGRKADIAPLFKSSSEVANILLQFQTALNCIYQQIRFDIPYQIRNRQYKQIVGTIIGYTMAGILVNSVVSGYAGDGDDDDKDKLKKAVFYATTQFTDAVPVVGQQVTNIVEKAVTGKGQYTSNNLFPVLETLKKTVNELTDGDYRSAAELFGQGIAYSFGFPVSGWKEIKTLLGIGDDDGKITVTPEALWGRR